MKKLLFSLALIISCIACNNNPKNEAKVDQPTREKKSEQNEPTFGIVIHGGAGTILKENMTPEKEEAYKTKLKEAIASFKKIGR